MSARRLLRLTALAALFTSASCSSDSATAPSVPPADLGQVLTEMSLPGLDGLLAGLMPVDGSSSAVTLPSSCVYAASSQSFVCPGSAVPGLRITQSYVLYDAAGRPQPQFGPTTTASVRTDMSVSGSVAESGASLKVDEQQQMTLSGLLTGHHVLDGTASSRISGRVPGLGTATDTLDLTTKTTIVKLALPPSSTGANAYPLSGTIVLEASLKESTAAPLTQRIELIFSGTSKVAVTVTGTSGTQHCTADLASSTSSCI